MTELTVSSRSRVNSIDIVRGIVMVIMALDHVRDFFHNQAMTGNPTDITTTTPILFFTRWITHFCAPVFVFLAGTSAYLMGLKKSRSQLSKFLISRGFWLVLMEITFVTLGWTFNPLFNLFILQVIWAIGISMIILGLLVWLPWKVILAIGLIIIFGHNLLDAPEAARNHRVGVLWNLVHHAQFSFYQLAPQRFVMIVYAFLPWTGIMIAGYCFGKLYRNDIDMMKRRKILIFLGLSLIALFIILRMINGYGDPVPWSNQRGGVYTFLSFLNVNKYPPSLMFICMTVGPAMLFLALIENVSSRFLDFFKVYGRVPFFYYILHFYIIHTLCVIGFYAAGYTSKDIVSQQTPFLFRPPNFGYSLWGVYAIWILVVLILYPLCRKYNRYKSTHNHWWLSYL